MQTAQDPLISLFRQLSEGAEDVFWVSDPLSGQVLYLSESYERLWGHPRQTVYDNPKIFLDSIHPDDRKRVAAAHKLQSVGLYDEAYRLLRPDGTQHWVRAKAYPIRETSGAVTRICGIVQDITAAKETESASLNRQMQLEQRIAERNVDLERQVLELDSTRRELQDSEERLRQLVEHVGQGMVVVQNGRFVFANPRALEITGYSLDELRDFPCFDEIIHVDDRAAVREHHRRRLAGEEVPLSYEFRILDKSGAIRWLELGGTLISWSGQQATLTFFSDITQRRALESELKNTLAERETSLQHSIVGIGFLTANGRLRWANDALARIFGSTIAEVVNRSLERYYPSREHYLDIGKKVAEAVAQGKMFETELMMRRHDGSLFWAYLSGKAVNPHDLAQGTVWVLMDISQRRELETRLQNQTAEQEIILQNSQIGISHTTNRIHQWANRGFCEMVGFHAEELIGQSSRIHFPDDETYLRLGEEAYPEMALGHAYSCETRMMRKSGEIFWVQMRGKNIDPTNPQRGAIWTVMDITEHKRLDETLRHRTMEQDVILQTCQIGLSFTRDRVIQWINRSFIDMLGFSAEELIGSRSRVHFPSDESFAQFGALAYPVLAQDGVVTCEWPMMRKSGEDIWLDMRGKNIDPDDPSKGTIWSVMDITPRKKMEEQLKATSSEREAILQSALVGITFSLNRTHQWVNRTFADMMGYQPEELIGQQSLMHYPDEASWAALGDLAYPKLAAGETFETEWQMKRRDGSLFWVQLYGCSVEPRHPERGTIWTFLDISRRKQAEEDTLRALEKQKELNELKSRFVSMTSHEFRTPLATILSSTELLRYYSDRLPAEEKTEILSAIEVSVRRMTQMLDNVLLIGKAEADMLQFKPADIDLVALCRDCAREAEETSTNRHKPRLEMEIAAEIGQAFGDDKLLRHVLGNLLSNAFKYSPSGGTVRFSARRENRDIVFRVTDEGIGIPAGELPRLFESFHRAENVGNIQGTGLGLAIVKKSVELHGGTIEVGSEVGRGSCFTVRVPDACGDNG